MRSTLLLFAFLSTVVMTAAATTQVVTTSPSAISAYPNQTLKIFAYGAKTNWNITGGATIYGGVAGGGVELRRLWTAPITTTVTVSAPAGTSGGVTYSASNVATTTVDIKQPITQTAQISPNEVTVYANQRVSFFASGGNNGYSFQGAAGWSGGSSSAEARQTWTTPTLPGQPIQVSVVANGNGSFLGASAPAIAYVTVLPPKPQSITVSPAEILAYPNQTVSIYSYGSSYGYTVVGATGWNGLGDGGLESRASWSSVGDFTVTIRANSNGSSFGVSDTVTIPVRIVAPPTGTGIQTVNLLPAESSVYVNQVVCFIATGSRSDSYIWSDEGVGVVGSSRPGQVTKSWSTPGDKVVTVTAPSYNGSPASEPRSVTVYVLPRIDPQVTLVPPQQTVYVNQTASFTAANSPSGTYTWSAGATPLLNGIASQSWTTPNSEGYTVTVSSPAYGPYSASSATARVVVLARVPQSIAITPNALTVSTNQAANLSAIGSVTGAYTWTSGGATLGTGATIAKTWSSPGVYVVRATSPQNGIYDVSFAEATITVKGLPQTISWVTAPPATATPGQSFTFKATGASTPLKTYTWAGAVPVPGDSTQATWTATQAGPQTITVQADSGGAYEPSIPLEAVVGVSLVSQSQPTIAPQSEPAYVNNPVTFSASGSLANAGYIWSENVTALQSDPSKATAIWPTAGPQTVTVRSGAGGIYAASEEAAATINVLPLLSQDVSLVADYTTAYVGQVITLTASNSNAGNSAFNWTGLPASPNSPTRTISWAEPTQPNSPNAVTVRAPATGIYAESEPKTVSVTVVPALAINPDAPQVFATADNIFTASGALAGPLTWSIENRVGDPDGSSATYRWSAGGTQSISVTAPQSATVAATAKSAGVTVHPALTISPSSLTVPAGQTVLFAANKPSDCGAVLAWQGAVSLKANEPNQRVARRAFKDTPPYPYTAEVSVSTPAFGDWLPSNLATVTMTVTAPVTTTGTSGAGLLSRMWKWVMTVLGGPVQVASGAEAFSRPLFHFNGAREWGLDVSYNSIMAATQDNPGPLGFGWTHPFEASLVVSGSSLLLQHNATHRNTFAPVGGTPGTYRCPDPAVKHDVLTTNQEGGWILTRRNQSSLVFDAAGRLVEDRDRNGRKLALAYNTEGKLMSVTEPVSGIVLLFGYDETGRLATLTDPAEKTVTFAYTADDATAMLSGVTNQNNDTVTFTYDDNHQLLALIGSDGQVLTTNTYDAMGRVVTQTDGVPGHLPLRFSYQQADASSNIVTTVTDKTNNVSVYTFSANYNLLSLRDPLGRTTSYTYDADGNILTKTNPLNQTISFSYDGAGNVASATDEAGKETLFTYDARGNRTRTTDPLGNVTLLEYDANNNLVAATDALGRKTEWKYDLNSLPIEVKTPRLGVTSSTYTAGRLSLITDAVGVVTHLSYDTLGRLESREDAQGNRTAFTYDGVGNLLTTTDPLNRSTVRTFDARNRLKTIRTPDLAVTSFSYDNNNNLISKLDALLQVTTYTYDGEDRPITSVDPGMQTTRLAYDTAGQLVSVTSPSMEVTRYEYDAAGRRTAVVDPLLKRTTLEYDSRGNLKEITDPLNRHLVFTYDDLGRRTSSKNALLQTTVTGYDALGRTVQVTDPASLVTRQAFDQDGNQVSLTNASTQATTFTSDLGGRTTEITTPGGKKSLFTYDALGRVVTSEAPSGATAIFAYDAAGQVQSATDPVGAISFTRDSNGRVLTVVEGGKTLSREYDSLGRVTKFTDGAGNVISYEYDAAGNLKKLIYPDLKAVTYTYDASNRLKTVVDWAARSTVYTYNAAGRLTHTLRPNGTIQRRFYDDAGQLTQLNELAPDGITALYASEISYDLVGRIVGERMSPVMPVPSSGAFSQTFDVDNRLLTHNGQPTTFDLNGNLLSLPGGSPSSFSYDARNRLISASGLTYGYDAEGRRNRISSAGVDTTFVVNPNATLDQVLLRTAEDGTDTRYIYGLGLAYEETGTTARYYHFSRRGDTVALSDGTGVVTGRVSYGVYGEVLSRTGQTNVPFLFNGLYGVQTDVNGLYFHRARYYNPQIRRFINQDSVLGSVSACRTMNRFAYGNGDPVSLTDPLGMAAVDFSANGSPVNGSSLPEYLLGAQTIEEMDAMPLLQFTPKGCVPATMGISSALMKMGTPTAVEMRESLAFAMGRPDVDFIARGAGAAEAFYPALSDVMGARGISTSLYENTKRHPLSPSELLAAASRGVATIAGFHTAKGEGHVVVIVVLPDKSVQMIDPSNAAGLPNQKNCALAHFKPGYFETHKPVFLIPLNIIKR
jgi:RHS repeat-associated protein